MDNILFESYIIEDRSYVSFIKREIHNLIRPYFSEKRTAEIDIVVSEITSNLIKHAQKGEILYRISTDENEKLFEMICIDNGPGIKDLNNAMKDGVSSKATLGQGIGAIMRLSNLSQFYTLPAWGTIVYTAFYNDKEYSSKTKKNFHARILNVAKPGEKVSGDNAHIKVYPEKTIVFVGDGLGHGPHAKDAVDKAILIFKASMSGDPAEIIREINKNLKHTRGLVATIATLDHKNNKWELCGVGNISTRLQKGLENKNYVCNNGIIGFNIPTRLENSRHELEKFQQLILCSDGIKTRWDLIKYPGLLKHDPMITAAILYKDHARQTDDMTAVIVKVL
jgi:anti-sigma regulatory factor (Ser/Thr protein kinase)